jgi:glycosyltransferase involved in cell wall biosynthesis
VQVAFVGSPKAHKGIEDLRLAVAGLVSEGYRLVVTGTAPPDSHPWETWVGTVPFEEGMRILDGSDVVAIPSRPTSWARAQLPAKLMDAMMAGKPVVVTDVGPMRWAVGSAGVVATAGDASGIQDALRSLRDPAIRQALGRRAWERARADYSVETVAKVFEDACDAAIRGEEEKQ